NGMASLNNDWMHLKDQLNHYLALRMEYENSFRNIISKGILKNEIKNINPDIMVFSILSTLRSLYLWVPKKDDMEPSLLAANLSEVLLKGINK
ncbi:MAG: TetR/AcrR family transcriptional regulator, partial [Flavobacteriaceae bacterium]|nr:TetR/AcrR family transcriptional regulator [Flavobacteriaceae bacterium]